MADIVDRFTGVLGQAADGLASLATGTATVNTAFTTLSGTLKLVPVVGDAAAKLTDGTLKYTVAVNDTANAAGKYGAAFMNNTGLLQEQTKNARMSGDEYVKMMANNSTALSGFGKNMDQSAKRVLEMGQNIQEADPSGKLKAAGVSSADFTNLMQVTMGNRRTLDIQDEKSKRAAIENTVQLAVEMEGIAKLTGKSREQQQKDLAAGLAKAEVQAELLQLDDDARNQYMKMRTSVGPLGESIQGLADEIATGGVRTKEGAAKMAALGPAGADFEKAVLQMKNAKTAEEKEAAAAAMEKAKIRVTEYQSSKEYLDQVKYDRTATGDAARKQMQENATLNNQLNMIRDKNIKTEQDLIDAKDKAVKAGIKGVDLDTGKVEAGTNVGQGLNKAQQALESYTAVAGTELKKLADSAGGAKVTLDAIAKLPQTKAQATEQAGTLIKTLSGGGAGPGSATPTMSVPYTPGGKPPVSREEGSFGSVGKLIEDFGKGTPAILHGKEGVITEKQLNSLISQVKQSVTQAKDTAKDAMPSIPSTPVESSTRSSSSGDAATMNDLNTQLIQLNKTMGQLLSYSEQMAENTQMQVKATKGLSGNRLAV